jgi:hypothetical protein
VPDLDSFDGFICSDCCTTFQFDKWIEASETFFEQRQNRDVKRNSENLENIPSDKIGDFKDKVSFEDFILCPLTVAGRSAFS